MFERYSTEWKAILGTITEKIVLEKKFRDRVITDFAKNSYCTSDAENKIMRSLATGLAVYGDFKTEAQEKLARKILFRHNPRLVDLYATEVGINLEDETSDNSDSVDAHEENNQRMANELKNELNEKPLSAEEEDILAEVKN